MKPAASIGDYCSVVTRTVVIAVTDVGRHPNCGCAKICFESDRGAGIAIGRYLRCASGHPRRDAGYSIERIYAQHQGMRWIMGTQYYYGGYKALSVHVGRISIAMPAPFDTHGRSEKAGVPGDHDSTAILVVGQIITEAGAVRVGIVAICVHNIILLQFAEGGRVEAGIEQVHRSDIRIGQQVRTKDIRRYGVGINEKNSQRTSRRLRVFVIFSTGCPNISFRIMDIA